MRKPWASAPSSLLRPSRATHITRISSALNTGLERRFDSLSHELLEVNVLAEEGVTLDLLGAIDAQSQSRVASQETGEERASIRTNLVAETEGVGEDLGGSGERRKWARGKESAGPTRGGTAPVKRTFWYISFVFSE